MPDNELKIASGQPSQAAPCGSSSALGCSTPHRKSYGELAGLYSELLYAVGRKYPNETRHETALRYIQEREADHNLSDAVMDRVRARLELIGALHRQPAAKGDGESCVS